MLLETLDEASSLMEISREELILKILKLWEKSQTLPLHGTDSLCRINPSLPDQVRQS